MDNKIEIKSFQGPYHARFDDALLDRIFEGTYLSAGSQVHVIIDQTVAEAYHDKLAPLINRPSTLILKSTESAKSLEQFPAYIEHLVSHGIRRTHTLLGIGGGIIQDTVCFIAATLLRGIPWEFIPTTLLAQADSCIGSKSSINVGKSKNIIGTFTPPKLITICTGFLASLPTVELHSGIGEMLKVHAIKGPASFDEIAEDFDTLLSSRQTLVRYIRESLLIKKEIIEQDEFDTGIRAIMNYGHSFGHALESATRFQVPHGIAVTIGMDAENFVAAGLGLTSDDHFRRMHRTLVKNIPVAAPVPFSLDDFHSALKRDKKNLDQHLTLILPDKSGRIGKHAITSNPEFLTLCKDYFTRFYDTRYEQD